MTFEPRPVHRLRQQVEEQLLEGIASGRLTAGDKLPAEAQLAEMFSVSRSTIREALRSLASAGLIDKVPGATGGSFVRELNAKRFGVQLARSMQLLLKVGTADRQEVARLRAMLEVPACRLAAENRTDEHVAALRRVIEAENDCTYSSPEVPQLDIDFHGTIAAASGNSVLAALVHALHSVTQPVTMVELSAESGRKTVRQHAELVAAIKARDADRAERAMGAHLDYLEHLRTSTQQVRRGKNGRSAARPEHFVHKEVAISDY